MSIGISSDILRGHTDTILLKLLFEGDKYGYELSKQVFERSGHAYELKEATMYSSLRRLESDHLVTSYWGDETLGGRRKYYHITDQGKVVLDQNMRNWSLARQILDRLL